MLGATAGGGNGKRCVAAGDGACTIANHYRKLRTIVCNGGFRRGVRVAGGTWDVSAVFLPLVGERCAARCNYGESSGFACYDG